jgi:hypothetical protein
MKKIHLFIGAFCLGLISLNAALTNESVVKMVSAGLGDDTIIAAIQKEECDFDVSVDGLIALKQAEVPDAVIKAMITIDEGGAVQPQPAASSTPKWNPPSANPGAVDNVSDDEVIPPFIDPVPGNTYYTRFTFFYERNSWKVTNYSRGAIIPINSEVKLVAYGKDEMTINVKGAMIRVKNVREYTNATIEEFASLMLSETPTKIELYGDRLASDIRNGQLRLGMTKQQVLMTRGYPPKHETPSIETDRWVYWSSRFVKRTLVFYDNILSEGRGIN